MLRNATRWSNWAWRRRLEKLSASGLWFPHVRELVIVVAAYFAYMYTRALVFSDIQAAALENARRVIEFEIRGGLFLEPAWQDWAVSSARELVVFFNWAYIVTFWPIIAVAAVTLYLTNRARYTYYRNIVLLTFAVALVGFMVFPLAPPRMVPEYFVDTIKLFGPTGYASREFANFYNAYAAMPSLHFGWTVLFGVLFLATPNKLVKLFGIIYPTMTLFAITITGNHYIMDAIGGGLLVLAAFLTMELGIKRRFLLPVLAPRAAYFLRRCRDRLNAAWNDGGRPFKQTEIRGRGRSLTSG